MVPRTVALVLTLATVAFGPTACDQELTRDMLTHAPWEGCLPLPPSAPSRAHSVCASTTFSRSPNGVEQLSAAAGGFFAAGATDKALALYHLALEATREMAGEASEACAAVPLLNVPVLARPGQKSHLHRCHSQGSLNFF